MWGTPEHHIYVVSCVFDLISKKIVSTLVQRMYNCKNLAFVSEIVTLS